MDAIANNYVYGWFNKDWGVYFYVGKGIGARYKDTKRRSKAFKAIYEHWNCEPVILVDNLTEQESTIAEEDIKQRFLFEEGYPIVDGEPKKLSNMAQKIGIEKAKAEGKYKGRKEVNIPDFSKHYDRYMSREISKPKLAAELNISRVTLDKLIKEHESVSK